MVNEEAKRFLRLVFSNIVQSVKPRKLLQTQLTLDKNKLLINSDSYTLTKNCYVVGFGKAVYEMACEVYALIGDHIQRGILSIPEGSLNSQTSQELNDKVFKIYQGARNNIPDTNSYEAAQEILELSKPLNKSDILLVLISGGGSALITNPIPPVTLEDKIAVTKLLSRAGANINEMNTVRKQLSMIKGGRLTEIAYPSQVVSLILSDIINDPPDSIASGPTVQNKDQSGSGLKILEKYRLLNKVSENVVSILSKFKNEQKMETFSNSHIHIIGNNSKALASGKAFIESTNKVCKVLTSEVQGNVIDVGDAFCQLTKHVCMHFQNKINKQEFIEEITALSLLTISEKNIENLGATLGTVDEIFLLFGGEPTVNVKGKGLGGRNMELALRFSENLPRIIENGVLKDFEISFLSAGTDGIDGPTDAAGAISYPGQIELAKDQGFDVQKFISDNDSYNFFKAFNMGEDLITIGHTGTNVMDIMILHIKKNINDKMSL